MKSLLKVLACIVAIIAVQSFATAQTLYSIADNQRDDTGLEQQYFQYNVSTGAGTLLSGLGTINREYEGLASIDGVLFGISEFATLAGQSQLCNTGSDPVTGLSSDLRLFRVSGTYPLANGVASPVGPQIGESCIDFGTETAMGYNPVDGFLYAIASDDLLPATAPRSRLYRVSPTTGLATAVLPNDGSTGIVLTAGSGGDANPYLDGMTCLANGNCFASEGRFNFATPGNSATRQGAYYRVFTGNIPATSRGRATYIGPLRAAGQSGRDTGLANFGNTLYVLFENGQLYNNVAGETDLWTGPTNLTSPGCLSNPCTDLEGADIPRFSSGLR